MKILPPVTSTKQCDRSDGHWHCDACDVCVFRVKGSFYWVLDHKTQKQLRICKACLVPNMGELEILEKIHGK